MEGQLWVLRLTSPLMKKFSVNTNFFFLYERHGLTILPLMRIKKKECQFEFLDNEHDDTCKIFLRSYILFDNQTKIL